MFLTIEPINPGHLMVVPKKHVPFMADMDEETGKHLFWVAMRMERALQTSEFRGEGTNLFLADGEAAFQEIFHVHLHVFPRYEGDQFRLSADWGKKPPREELDRVAQNIGEAYRKLWGSKD